MATEDNMRYRELLLHSVEQPDTMMAFWTLKAERKSTKVAMERLNKLRQDGIKIPNPHRCIITREAKVNSLPVLPVIPLVDSPLTLDQQTSLAKSLHDTASLLLYGTYGSFGRILRWNTSNTPQPELPPAWFKPPAEMDILDGTYISSEWIRMFLRQVKPQSL
ncbi:MAG: hypothetical protein NVSMB39_2680 [Candidatus Saccharimonadales bacterium]